MAFGGNKMGDAYVEMHGDTAPLKRDVAEAKTVVETETAKMGAAADGNIAKGFQKASGKVTGFIGAVTGMIGVAFVFERIGEKIGGMVMHLVRAGDAARDFRQDVSRLSVQELNAEIDKLNDSVTSWTSVVGDWYNRANDAVGLTEETSRAAKIAILEEARASRIAADATARRAEAESDLAKVQAERARAAAANRAAIDAENEQLEIDALDGVDRINAERERKTREMLLRIAAEEDGIARERLEYQLELLKQKYDRELQAFNDNLRKKAAAETEAARRQADILAKAMADAFQKAVQGSGFGQNIAGPIEELGRRIESKLDALKFGGRF